METQDRGVKELLSLSASGDIDAYQELFYLYSEKLYNFIYYLTYSREEAEDIAQESFIKVYEAIQGRDVSSFNYQSYIYKTAKNFALQAIARRKSEGLTLDEAMELEETSISNDPERAALLSQQRSKVEFASRQLTDEQEIALLLKELEGFSYDSIAEVLDSNPNAVGALLSRARLKFREVFRMAHAHTAGIPDACTQITPLLSKYIDKEASPDETRMIEAHLPECPICRENLASMKEASMTYRSLVPILPIAALKVWTGAEAALVGGGTAADAGGTVAVTEGTTATVGTTTATATATTAATFAGKVGATLWGTIAAKILTVAACVVIAGGVGVGSYMAVERAMHPTKMVPFIIGLTEKQAGEKAEEAKFNISIEYRHDYRTGNEKVVEQKPKANEETKDVDTITVVLADEEMESARSQAAERLGQANASLQEVQGLGIDTSDLGDAIQSAQNKYDTAKPIEELIGETDSSVYWSGVVINECAARKQAYEGQKAYEAEHALLVEECKAFMMTEGGVVERVWLEEFWMDDAGTKASASVQGFYASPPEPEPGRRAQGAFICVRRQGNSWVVVAIGSDDMDIPPDIRNPWE